MTHSQDRPAIAPEDGGLLEGWLEELLREGLPLPAASDTAARERYLAAARLAAEELAPAGAGIGARLQAVAYLCVQGAAIRWQGRANNPELCEDARLRTQRMASQLMGLASRQLAALSRLEGQRAKAKGAAAMDAWKQDVARTEALCRAMEANLREVEKAEREMAKSAAAVAAGPTAPLSRQQRRALERQERKAARRRANAGSNGAKPNGVDGAAAGP
ncbi:MAG: hypothetical protein OEM59_21685 [Rhodospirillales bacterium]|nr:hypothetical protein [Rhodospirillales bacterium]